VYASSLHRNHILLCETDHLFTLPIMLRNKGGPYFTVAGTISVQKR